MKLEIIRCRHSRWAIDGELRIAGQKICDTSENALHHIATGTYQVLIDHCHHYRRKMPIVCLEGSTLPCISCKRYRIGSLHANLPCFCPQIKIGNGVANRTDGSIIIGKLCIPGFILKSSDYFNRLIDRLDKAASRGEEITLTIA